MDSRFRPRCCSELITSSNDIDSTATLTTSRRPRIRARGACLAAVRSWLSRWTGIGQIIESMHRQGYDVQLTQHDERGWRATFYVTG
ncbi:MAG TPA: hypothetical protein VFB63_05705, partial [Bryobacteraceae bacterium]|nr:hypothetical protein [Bryobacteraceae bacterium]